MSESYDASMTEIMKALDTVVLRREDDSSLCVFGDAPEWFRLMFTDVAVEPGDTVNPGEKLLFLENFLIDAEEFWSGSERGMLVSEFWQEQNPSGQVLHLQASALSIDGQRYLLIGRFEGQFTEKQRVVQRARENALTHESLLAEIQKKEILLHAIVHDLSGPLTSMSACFDILSGNELSDEERTSMVDLGKKVAMEQKRMIDEILHAFSGDLRPVDVFRLSADQAPDLGKVIKQVIETHQPTYAVKNVKLVLDEGVEPEAGWKVVADSSQLVRVVANLVENALRHSPEHTTVTIGLRSENDRVRFYVQDEGTGVAKSLSGTLFHSFVKGKERSGKSGLGLYFCRITVEKWGGSIGVSPGDTGGASFWVRLRKPL